MKKILVAVILIIASSTLFADEEYYYDRLSYGQFVSWMQSLSISGFELNDTEQEGSVETYNLEYSAMFVNDKMEMLNVRIGAPNVFYSYEDLTKQKIIGPYDIQGFNVVYIASSRESKPSSLSYFLVKLPRLHATFSITAMTKGIYKKEQFETLIEKFNIPAIEAQEFVSWPDEIPIEFRLPGFMAEITKQDNNDPLVKSQYLVKVKKSNRFLRQLKEFYNEKKGWLDLKTFMDITLVCKTSEDFKKLNNLSDGDIIEFVYFIK